jgi:hypothetical protein
MFDEMYRTTNSFNLESLSRIGRLELFFAKSNCFEVDIPLRDIDLDWIIILFFIHINAFRVEKPEGISLQVHFNSRSQFGKLGFETFQSHFEALNDIFCEQKFLSFSLDPVTLIYT